MLALQIARKHKLTMSQMLRLAMRLAQHSDKHDQALLQLGAKWVKENAL